VQGDTLVVISLERVGGVRPVPPTASQPFELITEFASLR
jgi:hypothetical protein